MKPIHELLLRMHPHFHFGSLFFWTVTTKNAFAVKMPELYFVPISLGTSMFPTACTFPDVRWLIKE